MLLATSSASEYPCAINGLRTIFNSENKNAFMPSRVTENDSSEHLLAKIKR
jgi:hypothetical protein